MVKVPDQDIPIQYENMLPDIDRTGKFNFIDIINNKRIAILVALIGLILTGIGVFLYLNTDIFGNDKIEVISNPPEALNLSSDVVVEIAGAVEKPGVYKLVNGSRIEDLLISCGGLSIKADRNWVERYVNRAAKLTDSQKVYILSIEESKDTNQDKQTLVVSANNESGYQTTSPVLGAVSGVLININTATFEDLDSLPGIGQVYGRKIIEQRPYSDIGELLSRGIVPSNTYEKIKDRISVY